jgi:hypothetical protein
VLFESTGEERHGWRITVETPHGLETYGVLVAQVDDRWRARVLTFPRILWTVPGGGGTIKFLGGTPMEAEREAAEFIRTHCSDRGYRIHRGDPLVEPARVEPELPFGVDATSDSGPAPRKVRFLPVRFGRSNLTEQGRTGNLSETGIFVITEVPVSEGDLVNLLLALDADRLSLTGEVRWSQTHHRVGRTPGMGIRLQAPPTDYVEYVRTLP